MTSLGSQGVQSPDLWNTKYTKLVWSGKPASVYAGIGTEPGSGRLLLSQAPACSQNIDFGHR